MAATSPQGSQSGGRFVMLELMRPGSWLGVFALAVLLGCGGKSLETEAGPAAGAGAGSVVSNAGSVGSGGTGAVISSAGAASASVGGRGAGGQATCPTAEPEEGSTCTSPGLTCRVSGSVSCPETALCGALEVWHIECPIYPAGLSSGTCGCANPVGTAIAGSAAPLLHRATSPICPTDRAAVTTTPTPPCPETGVYCPDYCRQDSDCTAGANGRCLSTGGSGNAGGSGSVGDNAYYCDYDGCFSDADCPNGSGCECRDIGSSVSNNCVGSGGNCRSDIDCGPGGYCSPSNSKDWCGPTYHCHTPADTCVNDSDCEEADGCNFDATLAHWVCGAGCGPAPSPP